MDTAKISEPFGARLRRRSADKKVRAILILKTPAGVQGQTRQQKVQAIRESATPAIADIDDILNRNGGRRLAKRPNALGHLPVETTVAGLRALAASDHVRAIIEDQPVSLVR
jgi:hypothetical protein